MRDLKYLIAYVAPASAYISLTYQGVWSYFTVVVLFVLIPLAELVSPISTKNFSEAEEKKRSASIFFDLLIYLNLPMLMALLWLYLNAVTSGTAVTWELVGMTLSMGVTIGSAGINVAHELGHRVKKYEKAMAKILLTMALYTQFNIEHNRGHHLWVATPEDPSSARFGESLYRFWARSVFGVYVNAWRLENKRLKQMGKPFFSFSNEMIWFQFFHLFYLGLVWWQFGWAGVGFAVAAAAVGILLLETVNYIEHYGLSRKRLESGRYERVSPRHSWNSNHEVGRIFLYELSRHSDHHFKATRKYQVLRHFDESPQLPFGYPTSMLMATVPPLWFWLMDERAKAITSAGF